MSSSSLLRKSHIAKQATVGYLISHKKDLSQHSTHLVSSFPFSYNVRVTRRTMQGAQCKDICDCKGTVYPEYEEQS
jgi:hypothetical protein